MTTPLPVPARTVTVYVGLDHGPSGVFVVATSTSRELAARAVAQDAAATGFPEETVYAALVAGDGDTEWSNDDGDLTYGLQRSTLVVP